MELWSPDHLAALAATVLAAALLTAGARARGGDWPAAGTRSPGSWWPASSGSRSPTRRKPAHASLLDVAGPWPVYIAVAAVLALMLFAALAALGRALVPDRR